mmetsp:Transcript_17948/g.45993  ORF Transcript_17948/g.45993 Transcript_17948/m.45993 type:complete len:202 (+) Transcript_17948:1341-1946(+)
MRTKSNDSRGATSVPAASRPLRVRKESRTRLASSSSAVPPLTICELRRRMRTRSGVLLGSASRPKGFSSFSSARLLSIVCACAVALAARSAERRSASSRLSISPDGSSAVATSTPPPRSSAAGSGSQKVEMPSSPKPGSKRLLAPTRRRSSECEEMSSVFIAEKLVDSCASAPHVLEEAKGGGGVERLGAWTLWLKRLLRR